ncbi:MULTISPECIES: antitoxin [Kocuria]|uniref:antitoxin n=2 Tax=Kocuria TaxID=57493 RepID=UPI00201D4587|nr:MULTISPECIES: antitoxin [Kocuria]MCT1589632.1 antitoxin [Kocuria palustris]
MSDDIEREETIMVDLGGMADKAKQAASDNPEAVDKAADTANDKTGGQHEDQINSAKDKLTGGNDDN